MQTIECAQEGLVFYPDDHRYELNGNAIPSVTQVIHDVGMMPGIEWASQESRERGTAVHDVIRFLEEGGVEPESVDERIEGYVAAYEAFKTDWEWECLAHEVPFASPIWNYGGKFDQIGTEPSGKTWLIDFKTGPSSPWHAIQVCGGYLPLIVEAVQRNDLPLDQLPSDCRTIHLRADGTWKPDLLIDISYNDARTAFRSALNLWNWRTRHHGSFDD